jgi:uncharacterized protein (TIGR03437 family)
MNFLLQLIRISLSVTLLAMLATGMRPQAVASAHLIINQPVVDVGVKASTFYDRVAPGGKLYWLATVTNNGVLTANNVQLGFTFPAGVTVNACIPEFGACGGAGNSRTVTLTSLAPRQTRSALFTTTVDAAVAPGTNLSATVTLEAVANDENQSNNTSTALVTIAQPVEVLRAKSNGKIIYYAGKTSPYETSAYTIDPDGNNETNLPAVGVGARWSSDGAKLAFLDVDATLPSKPLVIFVSNPDGSGKVKVASDPESSLNRGFSWSPDGNMIVYSDPTNGAISIARADGGGQSQLPNSPQGTLSPEMSPNATRIVFVQDGDIWVVNLDGSGLRKIAARTPFVEQYSGPRWSPDGSKILFMRNRTNSADAMLVNPDGTGLTRAFNVPSSLDAGWSPDGLKVVFTSRLQDVIYTINYDGTNLLRLISGAISYGGAHWQPLPTNEYVKPLPDPPTFSISGEIASEQTLFRPLEVRVSGSATGAASLEDPTSSTPNRFTLVRLPQGGQFTVAPESLRYSFTPESRVYNDLSANITDANFGATLRSVRIRGRVVDEQDRGIPGLTVNIYPGFPTITNAQGEFVSRDLPRGLDYGARPTQLLSGDRYSPEEYLFPNLLEDATANFKRTRAFATIQGEIVDVVTGPVSGARVSYTIGGFPGAVVTTDATGKYSFGEVPANNGYYVWAEKEGLSLLPLGRSFNLRSPMTVNFYSGAASASIASAASFKAEDITYGSIVAMFGTGLAGSVNSAARLPLPTELDGVSLTLSVDAFDLLCPLFYISPQQINFLTPAPASDGLSVYGVITVKRNGRVIAVSETGQIKESAPALFTANSDGQGAPAAVALRVKANGEQVYEAVASYDETAKRYLPIPIDMSNPAEQVFLILYGTGIRVQPGGSVAIRVGREFISSSFVGPLPAFPGLDQVNIPLPRSLRGTQTIALIGGGGESNPVQIAIK